MTETKFNPTEHTINLQGKQYLPVAWRIVWFREVYPKGSILTEIAMTEPIVIKATIIDESHILANGFGTPKTQGAAKGRPFEGAETAAIGRALAAAGFGTQFTGEEEGEHLADAPVETDENKVVEIMAGDTIKYLVDQGLFEKAQAAAQVLGKLFPKTKKAPMKKIVEWSKKYRSNKIETGDTDTAIEMTLTEMSGVQ